MKFFKIFWFGLDKTYKYQNFEDVVEQLIDKSFVSIDTFNSLEDLVDALTSNLIQDNVIIIMMIDNPKVIEIFI